jgi:hypothetical protein
MLILTGVADAKVVYTATDVTITAHGQPLFIDLNNDGIFDLEVIYVSTISGTCAYLEARGKGSNVVERDGWAARVSFGSKIGPLDRFASRLPMVVPYRGLFECYPNYGPWGRDGTEAVRSFLGLRFLMTDGLHYGWASLDVMGDNSVTLTGYAYETVPGKSLKAGQTHSTSSISDSKHVGKMHPSTLGALAAGSRGLEVWRREEDGTL